MKSMKSKSMKSERRSLRAVLLGASNASSAQLKKILKALKLSSSDILIGIDGGAARLRRLGLTPDIAVGDWDSLKTQRSLVGLKKLTLPREKDRSDLFYAIQVARNAGAKQLVCLGVTGGRPDHHLAMLLELMAVAADPDFGFGSVCAIGTEAEYYFLSGSSGRAWRFAGLPRGQIISIFSLDDSASGVTLKGFRYPLEGAFVSSGSLGLSNEVIRKHCEIQVNSGNLLVVIPR
jgi:thiamine pyrophosphokinase